MTGPLARLVPRKLIARLTRVPPTLLIASTGRSGSTMLYRSAMRARNLEKLGGRIRSRTRIENYDTWRTAWTLEGAALEAGEVYKTHDYPEGLRGRDGVRALFVFGSASDTVLSVLNCMETRGADWIAEHFDHLKAPGRFEDLLTRDALGIEAQMRAWTAFDGPPVLCLRYEALWDSIDEIRAFTDLDMHLPPRAARRPKEVDPEARARIAEIYGPLDARIARLPDAFRAGPAMAEPFADTSPG